jgi:predicted N-acetyltransferase YhbS
MGVIIRPIKQSNTESYGKIGYKTNETISSAHVYPSEQPAEEFSIKLLKKILDNPNLWSILAEREDKILGSIFLPHNFSPSSVAVIGPLTVYPSTEGRGVDRILMNAAITHAHK